MDLRTLESKLSVFIVISVALHIAAGASFYVFAPERKAPAREGAYIVRIVTPEPPPVVEEARVRMKPSPPAPKKKAAPPKPPREELAARAEPSGKPPQKRPEAKVSAEEAPPEGTAVEKAPPGGEAAEETPPGPAAAPPVSEGEGEGVGKERLFDPEVLAGVIEKDRPKETEGSITFNTKEIRHYGYMRKLKARIEAVWEYPREAALEGIYGDLVVKFVIKSDGTLGSVELVRTSGWKMLDDAAIAALRDGAPYWPLPEDWDAGSLTVTGHFIYTLSGYYYLR